MFSKSNRHLKGPYIDLAGKKGLLVILELIPALCVKDNTHDYWYEVSLFWQSFNMCNSKLYKNNL